MDWISCNLFGWGPMAQWAWQFSGSYRLLTLCKGPGYIQVCRLSKWKNAQVCRVYCHAPSIYSSALHWGKSVSVWSHMVRTNQLNTCQWWNDLFFNNDSYYVKNGFWQLSLTCKLFSHSIAPKHSMNLHCKAILVFMTTTTRSCDDLIMLAFPNLL